MTMPGFTAAASHLETDGHYNTVSMSSAPQSTVQPQLDVSIQGSQAERELIAERTRSMYRSVRLSACLR